MTTVEIGGVTMTQEQFDAARFSLLSLEDQERAIKTFQVPWLLLTDGYKVDHRRQYPAGTTSVFSNFTARNGRDESDTGIIFFGLQAAIQHYLVDYVHDTFFSRPVDEVCAEYETAMLNYLGPNEIGSDHIRALHAEGVLPLDIYAVPEGMFVPYGVPCLTVENTDPRFFWLTNYIETLLSSALWVSTTSATTAFKYRILLEDWASLTGSPIEFVTWQGHDFSFRGMSSPESAIASGMGHLTSFSGTDTIPAIAAAQHYYDAPALVGGSVPATEHSVMCASGVMESVEAEIALDRRLITEIYKAGIVSIVTDTRDFFETITVGAAALKDDILGRDGKTVFRPDSGDPVKIICGDPDAPEGSPEAKGAVQCLYEIFGGTMTDTGYIVLDSHVGLIYGDSINLDRALRILSGLAEKGFASANIVFGIGSFTYQFVTRDNHGFAMKATWCQISGEEHLIYKDPKTHSGQSKKSARGRVAVAVQGGIPVLVDGLDFTEWNSAANWDLLRLVFRNGEMRKFTTFEEIREQVTHEVGLRRRA